MKEKFLKWGGVALSFSLVFSVLVQVGESKLEARIASKNSVNYPPKVVARCLDKISPDPSIDCSAVLASLSESKASQGLSIPFDRSELSPSHPAGERQVRS